MLKAVLRSRHHRQPEGRQIWAAAVLALTASLCAARLMPAPEPSAAVLVLCASVGAGLGWRRAAPGVGWIAHMGHGAGSALWLALWLSVTLLFGPPLISAIGSVLSFGLRFGSSTIRVWSLSDTALWPVLQHWITIWHGIITRADVLIVLFLGGLISAMVRGKARHPP